MTDNEASTEESPPAARVRRKHRPFSWTTVFSLAVGFLVFVVLALALSGRMLPVPEFLHSKIEDRLNESVDGTPFDLGGIEVGVSRKGAPQILMNDIRLSDASGGAAAQLNWLGAELSLEQLVKGEFGATSVFLSGAQITIRRTAEGAFRLAAGGPEGSAGQGSIVEVLARVDEVMSSTNMASLSEVIAGGVVLTLEDARSGRIWQATNASATLRKASDALTLSVTSDVFNGTDNIAKIQVSLARNRATGHVMAGFSVEDMPAADIALQSPVLAWLGVLDAPISGSVRTEIDDQGAMVGFAGTFDIDAGALQPSAQAPPVAFQSAKAYFTFDPDRQRIDFSEVSLGAEDGRFVATGHTYLSEFEGLWPKAYLSQFQVEQLEYAGGDVFQGPISLNDIHADMRIRLDPFTVELAQVAINNDGTPINATGRVSADDTGWHGHVDATTAYLTAERVMTFWPVRVSPVTRGWLSRNLSEGELRKAALGLRFDTGSKPDIALSFEFEGGNARFLQDMPRLTGAKGRAALNDYRFVLALDEGGVTAATGDRLDAAGSRFSVLDTRPKPSWGEIDIAAKGPLEAALTVLNNPPLRIMDRAKRPVDIAQAMSDTRAVITLPLKDGIRNEEVTYDVTATLTNITSDQLVEGRTFTSPALRLTATPDLVGLEGPAALDGVPLTANWRQPLGDAADNGGTINGTVALTAETIAAFDLPLPADLVSGRTDADYTLTLPASQAPSELTLTSDLAGLNMGLDALGWSKPSSQTGNLTLSATLGPVPEINELSLSTAGLSLDADINLSDDGALDTASFENVRVGDWLDASVTVTPSQNGGPPIVSVVGGTLDLRQIDLGEQGGDGSGPSAGGAINLQLDRLTVSDGISLAPLTGRIERGQLGMSGTFEARLNGRTPVSGTLAPANAGTAIRLRTANAGGVLRDAGLTPNARKGSLDLVLTPVSGAPSGTFDGEFLIENIGLKDAPAMADLLDAISLVGLTNQLSGSGIRFDTIDGQFRLDSRQIRLRQAAAVGTSMGISADGIYDLSTDQMDFRGVISPVYFLNGIGSLLTRRGEGLFGFNYRMSGSADDPNVGVNPLSILTPGAFRQIFRRAPPDG